MAIAGVACRLLRFAQHGVMRTIDLDGSAFVRARFLDAAVIFRRYAGTRDLAHIELFLQAAYPFDLERHYAERGRVCDVARANDARSFAVYFHARRRLDRVANHEAVVVVFPAD
jgi:hypothetical protein